MVVLFDLDGTLIDTEKYYRRCWPAALQHFGYPMTDAHALALRSLGRPYAPQLLKEWFDDPNLDYPTIREYRKQLFEQCVKEEGVHLRPGCIELLDYLHAHGITAAIATATDPERAVKYLNLADASLVERFDRIISATMVEHGKPSPEVYQYACKELGVAPSECIAVEDAPNGILSAYDAGLRVIMVPDQTRPEEEPEQVKAQLAGKIWRVADSLSDIIPILEKIGHFNN